LALLLWNYENSSHIETSASDDNDHHCRLFYGNQFRRPAFFDPKQPAEAVVSAEAIKDQTGYTTVYRDPNGLGPDGEKFLGRRNYTIVSGSIVDQSKGFDI